MAASLKSELQRVSRLIRIETERINNDANSRGIFHSGAPIVEKMDKIPQILEDEVRAIIENFSDDKDLEAIENFIDDQRSAIYKSTEVHGLIKDTTAQPFDDRIAELKGLLRNKQSHVRKDKKRLMVGLYGPIIISVISLVVSIIALVSSFYR